MPVLALCWARWSEASIWVIWLRDRVSSSRSVRGEAKAGEAQNRAIRSEVINCMVWFSPFLFIRYHATNQKGWQYEIENAVTRFRSNIF